MAGLETDRNIAAVYENSKFASRPIISSMGNWSRLVKIVPHYLGIERNDYLYITTTTKNTYNIERKMHLTSITEVR